MCVAGCEQSALLPEVALHLPVFVLSGRMFLLLNVRCRVRAKFHAARGRAAFATVPALAAHVSAADCALPGASKLRAARSRAAVPAVVEPVPAAAEYALPGASKSHAFRGRSA